MLSWVSKYFVVEGGEASLEKVALRFCVNFDSLKSEC